MSALVVGGEYREGFESGPGGWGTEGEGSTWAHGRPSSEGLDVSFEGDAAWVTNPTGRHASNESSFLVSPCFDASGSDEDLFLSFGHFYETESCCDESWLELSTDGGERWTKVVGDEESVGWYDDTTNRWWEGRSMGWRQAAVLLPGTAGQSRVRLRFAFSSDASQENEGVGIDDVRLVPASTDLGIALASGPLCGQADAAITNLGARTLSGFDVVSVVDGVESRQTSDVTLRPFENTTLTIGEGRARGILARVEAAGDERAENDEARWTYEGVETGRWDFEAGPSGWRVSGEDPSWAWGMPDGEFIAGASSGVHAWVTNLTGPHGHGELSYLSSPCLDLREVAEDPELRFAHIYETEACCDEGWVEVSIDGDPFVKLGRAGGGSGWYTDDRNQWWDGTSGAPNDWVTAAYRLDGAAGYDWVRVRFVMSSDGSVAEEGFGIDDVAIE